MISEEELFGIFSDAAEDEDRSFGERIKAAEFLMKYMYSRDAGGGEDRVVIIDDIGSRNENN